MPFEEALSTSGDPFLSGQAPDSYDFLLFGMIQCYSSIHVTPLTALQTDPRIGNVRAWIGRMQVRYTDYP